MTLSLAASPGEVCGVGCCIYTRRLRAWLHLFIGSTAVSICVVMAVVAIGPGGASGPGLSSALLVGRRAHSAAVSHRCGTYHRAAHGARRSPVPPPSRGALPRPPDHHTVGWQGQVAIGCKSAAMRLPFQYFCLVLRVKSYAF